MAKTRQELIDELKTKAEYRKKWEINDFMFSQVFIWFAIVLSFITALVAALKAPAELTAILAGLSGALVLIDKNVSFSKRSTWNSLYKIQLEKLRREIEVKNIPVEQISDKLTELELKMARDFPNADFRIVQ